MCRQCDTEQHKWWFPGCKFQGEGQIPEKDDQDQTWRGEQKTGK